ncbi:hypothetical protein HK405_010503 [Cladochytrium tenue]|nr:hypothetical protein HK405_010503 [Cladochytrium tenue]
MPSSSPRRRSLLVLLLANATLATVLIASIALLASPALALPKGHSSHSSGRSTRLMTSSTNEQDKKRKNHSGLRDDSFDIEEVLLS